MIQVIVSPAKQIRADADEFCPYGIPPFPERTARLHSELMGILAEKGEEGLRQLWGVGDRLLEENVAHLRRFVPVSDPAQLDDPAVSANSAAAVFAFVGIQYRSMAPSVMDASSLEWIQRHLWILSGFYGCMRPFHSIEPYRLEMGARLAVDGSRDLYGFWGDRLARQVAPDDGTCVVNLASVEYSKSVLPRLGDGVEVVTCLFGEELRYGKPVQRATPSKIARGSMVRWMAERGLSDPGELVLFDVGYAFAPELSSSGDPAHRTLVFMKQ